MTRTTKEQKCFATFEDEGIFLECVLKDSKHLKKGLPHTDGKVCW